MILSNKPSLEGFAQYMNEREQVRLKKEQGEPYPWTDDPILQTKKFTNVKRLHDKTTQHFKRNYYDVNRSSPPRIILLNCAIFRYFGSSDFIDAIGWQHEFYPESILDIAKDRIKNKKKVFTGAYIITNQGIKAPKEDVVVKRFLTTFYNHSHVLAEIAESTARWELVCKELRTLEGFGGSGFMAKEILQDAILTPVLENAVDRKTWTPCGLGAKRGLNRIFGRDVKASTPESQQLEEIKQLHVDIQPYLADYMPELDLHDVQFSLCEYDKLIRVKNNEGKVRAGYKAPEANKLGWF